MIRNSLYLGALALAILAACTSASPSPSATATAMTSSPSPGADVSIVGTWNCGPPDEPERDVWEISADGTVTIPQPQGGPLDLTWTVEGDRVSFQGPPNEAPDTATIESQDRLVFDDGGSQGDGFVCTRGA